MKKILAFLLAALMIVPALCACGKKEQTLVRLNEVTHSVFYAPQYVAMSQGFFEAEGLKVELTNGGGADKVMTAVVSGQSDIGLAGPEASIYVYNQGKEDHTQIIAQLTKRDGSFLVGRSDGEFSWEDLRGKTVIGGRKGGVPEMTLEYVLRQHGLTPGVDVTVDTSVQFNMMAGAFTGGQGDYVTLFEPTATQVEAAGQGYVLTSIGLESGEIPYTAYFANISWLEKNADSTLLRGIALRAGQNLQEKLFGLPSDAPCAEAVSTADGSWKRAFTSGSSCTAVCPVGSKVYFGAADSAQVLSARI